MAPARWRVLGRDSNICSGFSEFYTHKITVWLGDGNLILQWGGLQAPVLDTVLDHTLELLETLEFVDGEGWFEAAMTHGARVEPHGQSDLVMTGPEGSFEWQLLYRAGPASPCSEFSLALPPEMQSWCIEPLGEQEKSQTTGNPILDASLIFRELEPGLLERIGQDTEATGLLISTMMGLGMRLSGGKIQFELNDWIPDPSEHIEQALQLARFLAGEAVID